MKKRNFLFIGLFLFGILFIYAGVYLTGFFVGELTVGVDEGIKVIYSEFSSSPETTSLILLNDTELQNIFELTLEKLFFGKIIFNNNVNLTQDVHGEYVNLDRGLNISENFIEVNSSFLSSLNEKNATIYFYNLSFENPRILRNGEVCDSSICQKINYENGTLVFSVSSFSNYSVEETVTNYSSEETPEDIEENSLESQTPSGGGSGGGSLTSMFELDKDLISVKMIQGENKKHYLTIFNTGDRDLEINLSSSLDNFLIFSDSSFELKAGKSKIVEIVFFSQEKTVADAYTGQIFIKSGILEKKVNVIVEIQSKEILFDVLVDTEEKVPQGGIVNSKIKIINMGNLKNVDVILHYSIKDFEGRTLVYREESLFIEDELILNKWINSPEDIKLGNYVFYVKVSYGNVSAFAVDSFKVSEKTKIQEYGEILFYCLLGILIGIFIYLFLKLKKYSKKKQENMQNLFVYG